MTRLVELEATLGGCEAADQVTEDIDAPSDAVAELVVVPNDESGQSDLVALAELVDEARVRPVDGTGRRRAARTAPWPTSSRP